MKRTHDPRYAPPLVYVPEPVPRQVRLRALLAGTTGFFLLFGSALTTFGAVVAYAVFFTTGDGPKTMAGAGLLLALIGVGIAVHGARGFLARRRLYVGGTLAVGRVLSVEPTGTRINDRPVLRTRYEFLGPSGAVEGSSTHMTAPSEGAEVSVLYDPANPDDSTLAIPGAFPRPRGAP